ncbi:MAG TPA: choice-of-anchor K domain-containing protein [Candidatus Saccharimonadia bacterium]|nr:choice-of-anchor K domain-containing protein [Candidatus Saccharimonadia bacterium]
MVRPPVFLSTRLRTTPSGFSLVELIIAIVLMSLLAGVAITLLSQSRTGTITTKLRTDVVRLNQIISMYLADGGSLDGATTPEAVIAKLKTVRTDADAKRQVGGLTGRGVDIRLVPRPATDREKASANPRAVWNNTAKRFDISTSVGDAGVADFVLDDSLASVNFPTESRTRTTLLYNDTNGWVWAAGNNVGPGLLSPLNPTLALNENVFDPTVAPPSETTSGSTTTGSTTTGSTTTGSTTTGSTTTGSTTSGSTTTGSTTSGSTTGTLVTTLPKPINSPSGGTFAAGAFPTTITINSNGAPVLGSELKYRINGGSWIVYSSGFAINSGDKVESRNFATLPLLYADGSIDSDTYYKLVATFAGQTTPTWINGAGGPNLVTTYNNGNPDSVMFAHGDTRLDLGGGEYLDAGVENTMTFNRAQFSGVSPNTDFTLGNLVILNGTTFNDSEATSVTLKLALNLTQPIAQSGTVNVNFTMVSTPNTSDRLASADTVTVSNPTTSFTVVSGGVTYTLQLKLVSLDSNSGTVSGNTFYIYEGASASATLVGQFKSNK